MNPNSRHQIWSKWAFTIEAGRQRPTQGDVLTNARRYFKALFHTSTGQVRVTILSEKPSLRRFLQSIRGQLAVIYLIELRIEGPPAHDPDCRETTRRLFVRDFVERGFGAGAVLTRMAVGILAGDHQTGEPPDQLIVLPPLPLPVRPRKDSADGERVL